ncbi:glucosylceramidase [Vibrio sp. 10N.286.49.B3]|uniref:GH116 family glycosyl hydrolase n=1 Tax=Vibrio sp. 10N.286.49.B3 TaxID=1880855 RepID=UPI000C81703C|nr:GH116 family glycosyl hydrolase [Vibrio sp. 10N.286.49.B3]PMH43229.1 glucosylceramidase [Vibrio sp. 10N.286.49.B3]
MNNGIPYTSYKGCAKSLCSKGDAIEFIQPWYTPISTTPENTGMAVGGIGSAFTLTPNGDTPNFSFIPGIFIDNESSDIQLNDFYISRAYLPCIKRLEIANIAEIKQFSTYYPAIFSGQVISDIADESVLDVIKASIQSGQFYIDNADNFKRWNVDFSDKTQELILNNPHSVDTLLLVAIEFFDGLLINNSTESMSLVANRKGNIQSVSSDNIDYRALYPMAEYQYHCFDSVNVSRKVVSPIVKDDKHLCSLPMHWNHFELENSSDTTQVITLVQPLTNLLGATYQKGRDGVQDSACHLTLNPISQHHKPIKISDDQCLFSGVSLATQSPYASDIEGEMVYGVQANSTLIRNGKISITTKPMTYTTKVEKQVIHALNTGRTSQWFERGIYSGRESLSALVCVKVELDPQEKIELRFAQVMDHAKILLNGWQSNKAYCQYYQQQQRAEAILENTLPQLSVIEEKIVKQQQDFLVETTKNISDESMALHFATTAMNTLSFLSEATVWDVEDKFLVKECVDYPFFNSLDVYFYGSFSLMYLLPELDGCVMKEFAKAILAADNTKRRYWEYEDKPYAELVDKKYEGIRAARGAVIHDLGSPFDIQPDAYSWHNVKEWKDLAPKYILMVYRHYHLTGDLDVVKACWPAVQESIEFLSQLIEEGDTLPLTRGTDDTFDNLSSHGISIYCGSLWAAGLKAAGEIALLVDECSVADQYQEASRAALETVEESLWDEERGYYHFFMTPVQAKHLTGHSYEALEHLGLVLTGDQVSDKNALNRYLNSAAQDGDISKADIRVQMKKDLVELAPGAFTAEFSDLVHDSDNSFGDALLADTYLKLVGLEGLFSHERITRSLAYTYHYNFEVNSPKLGVANMTLADGSPHDAFQAQDVWIGVQYSVATAMKLAGEQEQAEVLMGTLYTALYEYAKIPFAAPEGFNCSVAIDSHSLTQEFGITIEQSLRWLNLLKSSQCLLSDGRVNPHFPTCIDEFSQRVGGVVGRAYLADLHVWVQSIGLKYTAGRYFRPGMIFSYVYNI